MAHPYFAAPNFMAGPNKTKTRSLSESSLLLRFRHASTARAPRFRRAFTVFALRISEVSSPYSTASIELGWFTNYFETRRLEKFNSFASSTFQALTFCTFSSEWQVLSGCLIR